MANSTTSTSKPARAHLLLLGLFLCCTLASARQLIRLQNGLECPEPGYFRDAVDCKRFYYCPNLPPRIQYGLEDEEAQIANEIIEKGVECPEGTIFDELSISCKGTHQMDFVPPECKQRLVQKPYRFSHRFNLPERKDGVVQDIINN